MFKNLFKSKVAITSIATFLMAVVGIITQLTHGLFGLIIPNSVILILTGIGVILSEILNRFFPSGTFVGSGQNWSVTKYIVMLGLILISLLQADSVINVLPASYGAIIATAIIPALQLIVRVFGGDTSQQIAAARAKQT